MRLGRIGFWYRFAVLLLKPLLLVITKRQWTGFERIPKQGGVILAANHISYVDPLALADAILFSTKRPPRYLAKASLFKGNGIVARTFRGAKQIPVHRNTADASAALKDAVDALEAGELITIYPEGTVTRDPGKWPMAARTGVARLALLSGAPVFPVAQWGAQEIHDSYRTKGVHLLPRHLMTVVVGPAVDLSPWQGKELSSQVLHEATDRIMDTIREMLEEIRNEKAPAEITPSPGQKESA